MDFTGKHHWDRFHFVPSDDFFTGRLFNDTFEAGGGNDHLHGGAGNDTFWAGTGDDHIFGGPGSDNIFAGNHDNRKIVANWGHDTVEGGADGDTINYSLTRDSVTIYGDDKEGHFSGNDSIFSGSGDDHIFGGGGKDEISGGFGADQIRGGAGQDTFIFQSGESAANSLSQKHDTIWDFNATTSTGRTYETIEIGSTDPHHVFHAVDAALFNRIEDRTIDTFQQAQAEAQFEQLPMFGHAKHSYEFVTNGTDGWLFADTDMTHAGYEYAIELKGVTDLSHLNILH